MDALEILREVSDAYRRLRTLSVTAVHLVESGDENSSTSNRVRMRFFYAAPNRMRFEQLGKGGMSTVADGENVHTLFSPPPMSNMTPRYSSAPASGRPALPHSFRSEFPLAGDVAFLFTGIEERVETAEVVREEEGCLVVSVRYAPSTHPSVIVHQSPVFYWVRSNDHMIMRQQGRVGHRPPTVDEISWSSHTISVESLSIDEALAEELFRFTPPTEITAARSGASAGSWSGFIEGSAESTKRVEHRGSHTWDGDTLVEHSRWKIRGFFLEFERRLSFSEDGKELRVGERIVGPARAVTGEFIVPLS